MSEPAPPRTGWLLPVLLAVSASAALGLGFLYLARPNPGELGAVRVVVTEDGKGGRVLQVFVAEAPLEQKAVVTPGAVFTGTVHYPIPYLTRPNLKLTCGKRQYTVAAETELGFTWVAAPLLSDFRDDTKNAVGGLEGALGSTLAVSAGFGRLKPGLIFEEFTWEAKGLRAPASALPPKTFEQKGSFTTIAGKESVVYFPVPYGSPPNVELGGIRTSSVVITECTAKSFKWRNVGSGPFADGEVTWTAKGALGPAEGK